MHFSWHSVSELEGEGDEADAKPDESGFPDDLKLNGAGSEGEEQDEKEDEAGDEEMADVEKTNQEVCWEFSCHSDWLSRLI